MNYSMIKIVVVLNKVLIEIITEILDCIIPGFMSINNDKIRCICSLFFVFDLKSISERVF